MDQISRKLHKSLMSQALFIMILPVKTLRALDNYEYNIKKYYNSDVWWWSASKKLRSAGQKLYADFFADDAIILIHSFHRGRSVNVALLTVRVELSRGLGLLAYLLMPPLAH